MTKTANNSQPWALLIKSDAEYAEIVRLIRANRWPCSDALTEEDGWQPHYAHLIWNHERNKLWLARYPEAEQITLPEFISRMKAAQNR